MYLSSLKLWNFRRFGSDSFDPKDPHLEVPFNKGINLLIGENDSGKSAIIDAIRIVLKTHSTEWIRIEHEDFYEESDNFRIECVFEGLEDNEAKNFTEWLGYRMEGDSVKTYLRLILDVKRKDYKILPFEVRAGVDDEGYQLSAEAKEYLRTTYLKPLRDTKSELVAKRNSRLSHILQGHEAFKEVDGRHKFLELVESFNCQIENYFDGKDGDGVELPEDERKGYKIKEEINLYLNKFLGHDTQFTMAGNSLKNILEGLSLVFKSGNNLGLGSHNLLFIAAELLHLQKENWDGLRLGLVEEIEAHLHPQVQLQVIQTLKEKASGVQLIFTTHSPSIGSKIPLENLIICHKGRAFPMGKEYTQLESTDYSFLERFLDVTKADLFFARGVILVEGWAEELLIPALAKCINVDLTAKGVSVINIGSTAFRRYSRVFQRKGLPEMKIPVAVITDVDVKHGEDQLREKIQASRVRKQAEDSQVVKTFVSPYWTLEYCIALSSKLRKLFYNSVLEALKEQKYDAGVADLTPYDNAINNIESYFSSWTEEKFDMANRIYKQILGEGHDIPGLARDSISKSIIAQRLAHNLENFNQEIRGEESIQYLIEAIDYAAGN